MKNLKNFAFGLLVAVLALGFSAFTSADTSNKRAPQWIYVQDGTDNYIRIPFGQYDSTKCEDQSSQECSFTQPENDTNNHNSPLTRNDLVGLGMIPSLEKGEYNP